MPYTSEGMPYARVALQTSTGRTFVLSIRFTNNYPNEMPRVFIDAPAIAGGPHRYGDGNICFMHPDRWNPGRHDLTFVVARAAKWISKYEVWRHTDRWPGAQIQH